MVSMTRIFNFFSNNKTLVKIPACLMIKCATTRLQQCKNQTNFRGITWLHPGPPFPRGSDPKRGEGEKNSGEEGGKERDGEGE
jgi:hypothetical protein